MTSQQIRKSLVLFWHALAALMRREPDVARDLYDLARECWRDRP